MKRLTSNIITTAVLLALCSTAAVSGPFKRADRLAPKHTPASPSVILRGNGPATAPHCEFGFQTQQQTGWLLICRKIVAPELKNLTLAQAGQANCNVSSYWNYGPQPKVLQDHKSFFEIQYTCGHVEG